MASEGTNNTWPLVQLLAVLHQINNKGPLKIAIWHEMEMSGLLGADRGAKRSPALYTCARVSVNVLSVGPAPSSSLLTMVVHS